MMAEWKRQQAERYPGGYEIDYPTEADIERGLYAQPWGTVWCGVRPCDDQPILFEIRSAVPWTVR